jgi:hypothetical protein
MEGGTTLLLHPFENCCAGDLSVVYHDAREPQHGLKAGIPRVVQRLRDAAACAKESLESGSRRHSAIMAEDELIEVNLKLALAQTVVNADEPLLKVVMARSARGIRVCSRSLATPQIPLRGASLLHRNGDRV